ncbi:uncharacterized protein [Onthophagus taurus]|uniref:uncharacterized protein isoform X2 n=1 Tax=Onthophagus taurus TaxID=166361 RepID=UPI0039BE3B3D
MVVVFFCMMSAAGSVELGSECNSDWDCRDDIPGSMCLNGRCLCQSYYARVNNTFCVQSTLLGYDCMVPEQCTMKVANSSCLDGVCRCVDGFLQFRKHTCLAPARPSNVCYSNAHCRLWTADSHCDFLIPNLFGRCQCNSPFRQVGDSCVRSAFQEPTEAHETSISSTSSTSSLTSSSTPSSNIVDNTQSSTLTSLISTTFKPRRTTKHSYRPNIRTGTTTTFTPKTTKFTKRRRKPYGTTTVPKYKFRTTWKPLDAATRQGLSKRTTVMEPKSTPLPIPSSRIGDVVTTISPNSIINTTVGSTPSTTPSTTTTTKISTTFSTSPTTTTSTTPRTTTTISTTLTPTTVSTTTITTTTSTSPSITPQDGDSDTYRWRNADGYDAVSLGLPCVTDLQCQAADASSRCRDGVCDCIWKVNNGTDGCSARNTGCIPGTFQCRSSGTCISWFFVCDGRRDCSDGSDEECTNNKCPIEAFYCPSSNECISRASRCDGTRDCKDGEDEKNCFVTKELKQCPPHTFQCNDGKCIPEYEFCNAIIGCKDASDEPPHICKNRTKKKTFDYCPLQCGNGRCRSNAIACSGRDGCGDGSDEINCSVCRCPVIKANTL